MIKKLFLSGRFAICKANWLVAMLLVLSLALNATPAFAQGTAPGSGPASTAAVPLKLATITDIATLLTYPAQLVIAGKLPSPCYSAKVTYTVVQPDEMVSVPVPTISIYVWAVPKPNVMCSQVVTAFSTTISAGALKLAPGRYLVLINPVNGQSAFKTTIVIR